MEEKNRYLLSELFFTFLLLSSAVFLLGDLLLPYRIYFALGLIGGFSFSWFIRNKKVSLTKLTVNVAFLGAFAWIIYSLLNSSLIYKEVLTIFIEGLVLMEVILSFNSCQAVFLTYIQALSLPLFMCFPIFVKDYNQGHIVLVLIYIICWMIILKINFYAFLKVQKEKKIKRNSQILFSAVIFLMIIFVSWRFSSRVSLGKLERGGIFSEEKGGVGTETETLEKDYYSLQDEVQKPGGLSLKSAPEKVTVMDKEKDGHLTAPGKRNIVPESSVKEIKDEAEKYKQVRINEEKKLILIKIIPDTLEIPLGETRQVKALGVYGDGSEEDLTHTGEWSSSDDKIVKVSGGKIDTFSQGEAKIYVKFLGIRSLPLAVKVVDPKLLSIILSPQNLKISMLDNPDFKAEGYFSNSSRKDLTSLVTWKFTNPGIIKIKEGKIIPMKFGKTEVLAEYAGIKSLPANIRVIITLGWVIYMIMKGVFFLFLGIAAMFVVLYIVTEEKKKYLKSLLHHNPREFIINLYENAEGILDVFNLSHKEWMTPLYYAGKVQEKYSIENNLFSEFSAKFEEAKYSLHSFSVEDASMTLNNYNDLLKIILSRHNKFSLFLKYCLTLLHCRPLFISNP